MNRLVEFLEQFKVRAIAHEENIIEEVLAKRAFSYAYDTIIKFVNDAIAENNTAIDGDAICEYIDSEFPRHGDQEYIDELETVQFIVEDIISEMHL